MAFLDKITIGNFLTNRALFLTIRARPNGQKYSKSHGGIAQKLYFYMNAKKKLYKPIFKGV